MWTIQLFGGLSALTSQRELTRFRTQKAASLLGYLAFHPAPQPREVLLDLLWPDAEPEVGRHNLSNALSFLRHQLEPPGVPPGTVILADRASVRLNPAAVTVDAVEFEKELNLANAEELSEEECLRLLLGAIERYQGGLLPGYYEEWVAPEGLRLEGLFVHGVIRLVPLLLNRGKREQALSYAQRAVSADPLNEEATRCLMQAFFASGQSSQALRAYRVLETRLEEELDAQPSETLQRLAEQLGRKGVSQTSPVVLESALPIEEGFALVAASQTKAVPAEPALDTAVVHSLPAARLLGGEFLLRTTTRFFGREEEIDRLGSMLSTARTRLVTLTGPGGTGKTRLALEVAAHLVERTADTPQEDAPTRVVFVSLAPITEGDRLFEVILRSLGIVPISNQEPLSQLASVLEAHPHTLLVLDNFEQLVEAGALRVHHLLGKSATVKLLITSRQRLHIEGEREFHLTPLPTSGGAHTPAEMLLVPSIALFVDRAQIALPDFQLTERNASFVAQLCDYLEGLPLAIELAAARVGVLTPARILEQVQANRLDFLATRRRDAVSRQKTLRATLDWSYHLLPEAVRGFLATLSVFRGGWKLEAAEAVCALSEVETLDLVTLLRDSSLLQVTDTDEGMRFTLLETIREYGEERLKERGEDTAVRRRHRDYFASLAVVAEPELEGPDQARWLNGLQTEHDNLCTAIAWCETDAESTQAGLRLVGALSRFWNIRGYLSLGRGYLIRALRHAEASAPTAERAKALQWAGALARNQGDFEAARALNEESLAISRELGDKAGIAQSLYNLGRAAYRQGDLRVAQCLYEESLAISRELGDRAGVAQSLNTLGSIAYSRAEYDVAKPRYEEALTIRRELGDQAGIAISLYALGCVAAACGEYDVVKPLYEETLTIRRKLGDKTGIALSLYGLGMEAFKQGDYEEARTLSQESLALFRETGHFSLLHALGLLGHVERAMGNYARATSLYQESLLRRREQGDVLTIAQSLEDFAGLAERQGQSERAVRLLGAAEVLYETVGRTPSFGDMTAYKRTHAAAQAALSEEAFAAIWEAGRAMTQAQAVAYALGDGASVV